MATSTDNSEISISIRSASGTWSAPKLVSPASVYLSGGRLGVGISGGGETFATWSVQDTGAFTPLRVEGATGSIAAGWRGPFTIARLRHRSVSYAPRFALADGPHAIVGWDEPYGRATAPWVTVTR